MGFLEKGIEIFTQAEEQKTNETEEEHVGWLVLSSFSVVGFNLCGYAPAFSSSPSGNAVLFGMAEGRSLLGGIL